jgi:hypothetical protein
MGPLSLGALHNLISMRLGRTFSRPAMVRMPFERARSQLLLGQLQRRQRQKDLASATFHEALQAFETMGTPCGPSAPAPNWPGPRSRPARHSV